MHKSQHARELMVYVGKTEAKENKISVEDKEGYTTLATKDHLEFISPLKWKVYLDLSFMGQISRWESDVTSEGFYTRSHIQDIEITIEPESMNTKRFDWYMTFFILLYLRLHKMVTYMNSVYFWFVYIEIEFV